MFQLERWSRKKTEQMHHKIPEDSYTYFSLFIIIIRYTFWFLFYFILNVYVQNSPYRENILLLNNFNAWTNFHLYQLTIDSSMVSVSQFLTHFKRIFRMAYYSLLVFSPFYDKCLTNDGKICMNIEHTLFEQLK